MLKIIYSARFVSQFERLDKKTQKHAIDKIKLFLNDSKHPSLRTHKLNGQLKNQFSFSTDYTMRVVFEYAEKSTVIFLKIGDHSVYR